jgi:hypothetical protein
VLQALILFREQDPGYRTEEIEKSVRNAAMFIESIQEENGSWFALMNGFLICLGHIYTGYFSTVDNIISSLAG